MLSYDMPYFRYSRGSLLACWYQMFSHFNLVEDLKINPLSLQNFLLDVSRMYQRVPFHNMTHAFNVSHVCFYILCNIKNKTQLTTNILQLNQTFRKQRFSNQSYSKELPQLIDSSLVSSMDILSLLLACLAHDLDHPGLANTYFQKAKDYRALTVNNNSILENYHLHCLFKLVDKHDLFHNFSGDSEKYIRGTIQEIILCTDMQKHFAMISEVDGLISKFQTIYQNDEQHPF